MMLSHIYHIYGALFPWVNIYGREQRLCVALVRVIVLRYSHILLLERVRKNVVSKHLYTQRL